MVDCTHSQRPLVWFFEDGHRSKEQITLAHRSVSGNHPMAVPGGLGSAYQGDLIYRKDVHSSVAVRISHLVGPWCSPLVAKRSGWLQLVHCREGWWGLSTCTTGVFHTVARGHHHWYNWFWPEQFPKVGRWTGWALILGMSTTAQIWWYLLICLSYWPLPIHHFANAIQHIS